MVTAERSTDRLWTAETFLTTDQTEFGPAWRYELVNGRILAHAAPRRQQRDTARIPDVSIRCGEHPRVVFEGVIP